MTTSPNLDYHRFEKQLNVQKAPEQRLITIDRLASYYAFTNVKRANRLLKEQLNILHTFNQPDFRANYHLNKAFIDNQLYQYRSAEQHYIHAINILEERGNVNQLAETYIDYAGICINLSNKIKASEFLAKADKLLQSFPDKCLEARLISWQGFLNLHYKNYSAAIELLLKADKHFDSLKDKLGMKDRYFQTLIYSGLGSIYERNKEYSKSIEAYQAVVQMSKELGMKTRLSWHYLNVGNGLMAIQKRTQAKAYFFKVLEVEDDTNQKSRAYAYANLGYCQFLDRQFQKALSYYQKAEDLFKEVSTEDYVNFSKIEIWRGDLYAKLGEKELAMEYYLTALEYAQLTEDYLQISAIYKQIAEFHSKIGEYKFAYDYQVLHDEMAKKHSMEVNQQLIAELEVKYEAEKERQKAKMARLEATKLQLKALRAQMNPHFMYNALNSIQNFITSNDAESASKYLAKFATLMRQSLDYSDLESISLEKEIEFLENYLFINAHLRFEGKLKYDIAVDDEIEEDIMGVPTMIVQPYVENAIEHGIRTKGTGLIKVKFSLLNDDTILCVVEDNGIGREKNKKLQQAKQKYQNHKSKGTLITEKRLQILHNSKDSKVFVNTIDLMDIVTNKALGTKVEIQIPIIEIQMR